jgi:hypothetical protein
LTDASRSIYRIGYYDTSRKKPAADFDAGGG